MVHTFTVSGAPKGKARPRWTPNMRRPYNPDINKNYESDIAWCYRRKFNDTFGDRQIGIYITAVMPIPKSAPKKSIVDMMVNKIRPTVKPDWDNIGKIVCDALNGVAYDDDKQIVAGTVSKIYGTNPGVTITLYDIPQKTECRVTETAMYDMETIYPNCTVQVWENSVTGDISTGWWRNDG